MQLNNNSKKSIYGANNGSGSGSGKQGFTTLLTSNPVGLKKSSSSGSFVDSKNNSNGNIKKT